MEKYELDIPLPIQGINYADDSLIADNEAAEGTVNISFRDGQPQTRRGYIKQVLYAHTGESVPVTKVWFHSVSGVKRLLFAVNYSTFQELFQMNETKDPVRRSLGLISSPKPSFLPISCSMGATASLTAASRNLTVASIADKTITVDEAITADDATALVSRVVWIESKAYSISSAVAGTAGTGTITVSKTLSAGVGDGDAITPDVSYSEKVLMFDGVLAKWFDEAAGLTAIPAYTPTADEIAAYGTNVLSTTPNEINYQKYAVLDNNRIWLAGYENYVRVSHLGMAGAMPDYWPSTQVIKLPELCTGMVGFMGEILLFTENKSFLISGSTPIYNMDGSYTNTELPGGYGCSAYDSIAVGDNAVYWANRQGIYRYRYLPSGYSIPECISEFITASGNTRTIRKKIAAISDWTKVFANFYSHEYRLYIGNGEVLVFDTINGTWALYDYAKTFNCGATYLDQIYYGASQSDGASTPKFWIYRVDFPFDPDAASYNGLSDDGTAITCVLKSKFFDFEKAANKKRFKRMYFTLYSELVSYDIDLTINMDNEETIMTSVITNKASRWGNDTPSDDAAESVYALAFGDELNTNRTNLNYPVKLRHKGKKYNIQYELLSDGLNHAWLLKAIVLIMKQKELK